MKARLYILILFLLPAVLSCRREKLSSETEPAALLEQSAADVSNQRFDTALEKALSALALSEGEPQLQVRSLATIVGIDIMASRDEDAWTKALEAEALAREHGLRKELAGILISKAKLCSYAEISPETGRNDEGLGYATEALHIAEQTGDVEAQAEACYVIGSLYINKNRWSNPIDEEIHRTAGAYLDRGQALSDSCGLERLRRNGIMFRSRWFQQGDNNVEAIHYFEQVLDGLQESDYLTAAALEDRLVRLYTRVGEPEKALDTHDDYVYRMQKYIQQKQDETLQEMETRFRVQEKDRRLERSRYQILLLVLLLLLSAAVILLVTGYWRRERRRAAELQRLSDSKEQLIALLSRDLQNPTNVISDEIARLSASVAELGPEEIRERCRTLASEAETLNTNVAGYVGDILLDRARRIADIGLSSREISIIRFSSEGLKAAEIAERTFLSVHTVNTHRQRIYAKMDVRNVSEMLRKATELGII